MKFKRDLVFGFFVLLGAFSKAKTLRSRHLQNRPQAGSYRPNPIPGILRNIARLWLSCVEERDQIVKLSKQHRKHAGVSIDYVKAVLGIGDVRRLQSSGVVAGQLQDWLSFHQATTVHWHFMIV